MATGTRQNNRDRVSRGELWPTLDTRRCSGCKLVLPRASFGRKGKTLKSQCRDCCNQRLREWRLNNPDYVPRKRTKAQLDHQESKRLFKEYGITLEDKNLMVLSQNNLCALCRVPMKRVHVDHDHATGKVRELLCGKCNKALGLFGDDPGLLRLAACYIEFHRVDA